MQLTLDIFANSPPPAPLSALAAVEVLASQGNVEARGAVFTRREVVDFILDLAGYTPDQKRRLGKAAIKGARLELISPRHTRT